jgi:hypothetical protein
MPMDKSLTRRGLNAQALSRYRFRSDVSLLTLGKWVLGSLGRSRQRTVGPPCSVGFHGVDLVALETAKLSSASAVGHCHQQLVALRAAMVVHGFLPARRSHGRKNITDTSSFKRKARVMWFFFPWDPGGCVEARRFLLGATGPEARSIRNADARFQPGSGRLSV